jgi:antitoxin ParD1/3/4
MAREIGIQLADHLGRFVEQEIAGGRFGSANEVIEAALIMLEERESRLAKLRAAVAPTAVVASRRRDSDVP